MNWKEKIRLACRVFTAALAAVLIASAILFGLLQTNWGISVLAQWASRLDDELDFVPGRVSGLFPFRFEMERLSITDTRGVWLDAKEIRAHWSPLPLIGGRLCFKELLAASVDVDRPPASSDGAAGAFPSWILAFRSDRFHVDRLTVGKDFLGEQAVLKLQSRIPWSPAGQDAEVFLRIERVDRAGSLLLARWTLQAQTRFLKTELSFEEERDGLLSKALGVEGPLSLSLTGEGTPDLWQGKLLAGVLPFGRLASDLEVKGAETPLIKMQGRLHPTIEAMPSLFRIWMDRDLPFELETRLPRPEALIVERFEAQSRELDIALKSSFDFKQRSSAGQFNLTCRDLKPLTELLDLPTAGRLVTQGTFSTKDKILSFSVTGSAEDLQVGGSQKVLGKSVSWEFLGEGSASEVLRIRRMSLRAENLVLEGSGEMRIPELAPSLDTLFEIKDLQALSSLEPLAGWSTRGRANASWNHASHTLSSRFQGKLRPPAGVTSRFPAKEVDYTATLSLEEGAILNLAHLEIVAPWGTLQGQGKAHVPQESVEATWHLFVPDLGPVSAPLKGGPVEARGTLRGPWKAMTLSADASARSLSFSGFHLDMGHAVLQSELGAATRGSVTVDAQVKGLALQGRADFDWSGQHLNLQRVFLEGGKSTLAGDLILFLDTSLVKGELRAECRDMTALSPLLQETIQGSALLQARLLPSEQGQELSLIMDARNLESPLGKVLSSRVEAHGNLQERVPRGRVTLEIQNGLFKDVRLSSSSVTIEGDSRNANFRIAAKGHYKDLFEIKSSGLVAVTPAEERVTFNRLEGHYGSTLLSLLGPAAVARSLEGIQLGTWLLKVGSGQIQGSGQVRSTDVSLDLSFDAFPLQLIPMKGIPSLGGQARGYARLSGSPVRPEGTANLRLETLRFQGRGFPSADLTVQAILRDNRLQATLILQGLSPAPLTADVQAPLTFSLSPLMLAAPSQGEWTGALKGEINLEPLGHLVDLHEQKLSGVATLDLKLNGSWDRPGATGEVRLTKGAYENLRTGTIFKEIEVEIEARTPLMTVNKATATDGEKGRLSAQGLLELSPLQGFPFQLNLSLERAKPFRYDWGSAVLGGDLTLTGSFAEALLAGRIRVDTAEFRIPDRLAPEIQNLQVIEINKPGGTPLAAAEAVRPSLWPLSLDLVVLSLGRVFLTGRGLDSEWQGEVRISGEATQPTVAGTLSVVRGSVNFLGKRFELKRGSIFLDGSSPPSPRIDVEAESKSKDIVATLHLLGPVQRLEMKLTSDPPFPQDEILSRLLFGRSASNITPLQALQLADSVNTLARGGGLDLLARTRQVLGLDQLTLKPTGKTQEKTALSAGKYLSEDVYLEVEQGVSPETGKASLKWEITPNITVQTEVGVNAEAGVGIHWRWDY